MKSKPRTIKTTERTAYHEAGHAVIGHFLGLGLERVTIVRDEGQGHEGFTVAHGEWDVDVEELRLYAEEAFWIRCAIARYAGAEAVRRLRPNSRWREGADRDYSEATDALRKITNDTESFRALQTYAMRRSRLLVENYWPEIRSLATALITEMQLGKAKARKIVVNSLQKRKGRLMSY